MWTNYHCHTNYCDGKKSPAEVVTEAVKKNMLAIGLSSHAPLPFERFWCMKHDQLDSYLADIDQLKKTAKNIEVYAGLEVDYIPETISPNHFIAKLDYTVGSVHFVDAFHGSNSEFDEGNRPYAGQRWEIDGTSSLFFDGLQHIFGGDIKAAISRYFELTREMVNTSPPDILGHMDKIKMHNRDNKYFRESDAWYREEVLQTLDSVRKAQMIIEVNTRGIYQKKTDTTYPSPWVLKEILDRGIPVTLSSDAHHPDDLVNHFPEAAAELMKIGFKKIRILLNGRWTDVAFNENGIDTTTVRHYPMA